MPRGSRLDRRAPRQRAADEDGEESEMAKAPRHDARTNRHLARVTTLAVAALIGAQWLASAAGLGVH